MYIVRTLDIFSQHCCLGQAPYIDKTDFLNVVVREKKRFENTLDDCVAAGLNAGTQVLMNQVRVSNPFLKCKFTGPLGGTHHPDTDKAPGVLSA
jgi:hypothetical protein